MNEDDIKYRQGRSKRQAEGNEKIMLVSCCGLAIVLARNHNLWINSL